MENMKPLYSPEAEEAALGSMMMDQEAALEGRGLLKPEYFYNPAYRTIFEAMQGLDVVDVVTIMAELNRRGEAEKIGLPLLSQISCSVGSSVNLRHYAKELKRLAYFRRCIEYSRSLTQAAMKQDGAEIERTLLALREDGYGDAKIKTLAEATEEYITEVAEIRASGKKIIGLTTGFRDIDAMLGGLRNGDYCILAARPSMGKSALALDIARNAQKSMTGEKERAVVFSLEMPAKALGGRGFTSEYGMDNDAFSIGKNDADWMSLLQTVEENSTHFETGAGKLIVNDKSGMTIEDIRATCHGYKTQGIDIRLVVIDYLQLIVCKGENRTREIGEISRSLKQMAKDLDCPFLVLSQLNRQCEGRADKRPMLSDLRESGDVEQDADVVMFIYRDEYYYADSEKKGIAEINIAKQRNGPTGTVDLCWLPRSTTFRNLERFRKTNEDPPEGWDSK